VLLDAQKPAVKICSCDRATLAVDGEIENGVAQEIITLALPAFVGSAVLVAVMVTVDGVGTSVGATYVALVAVIAAMVPETVFPPPTPFTLHVTLVVRFPAPETLAVKTCAPPPGTVAVLGETETTMLSCKVTVAEPLSFEFASLIAVTITVAGLDMFDGAV